MAKQFAEKLECRRFEGAHLQVRRHNSLIGVIPN
jgi:hypothetical protein